MSMCERKRAVVSGWNDNLSMAIRESVLAVDDRANQAVRELFSPVVGSRNGLYDDASFPINVHPSLAGVILIEDYRQAVRIKLQLLHIVLCDKQSPFAVLQNAVWMTINVVSLSKDATISRAWGVYCETLGFRWGIDRLSRVQDSEPQETG